MIIYVVVSDCAEVSRFAFTDLDAAQRRIDELNEREDDMDDQWFIAEVEVERRPCTARPS